MQPAEKTIRLELNLKPLSVRLVNKPTVLLAEKEYSLTCEAVGSRPQAELSWLRETYKFRRGKIEDWSNETVVTSTVTFAPVPEDDGHHIKCHGVNPKIPGSSLEDTIMLNVVYAPLVSLQLGTSLKPQHIKHGDDVYFECNIRANPREHKISWFHNGNPVVQNVSSGVIISTHSLVLQGVTRQHSGQYTCLAANERGETASQPVPLRVQFAPVCLTDEPGLVGASLEEMLRVRCEVSADPTDVSFFWQFNNSGESFEVAPTKYVSNNGTISELMYTPSTERDYGTLACWGKNAIGRQLEPCIFQVVPAARPSALRNCTLRSTVNTTGDWLEVECVPGFDGGLPQTFQLEAIDPATQRMRMNLTNAAAPLFKVSLGALSPAATQGGTLQLVLYAANQKGHSESVVLEDIAIRDAEKRTEWVGNGGNSLIIGPLNLLLLGVILSLLAVTLLAAVVAVKRRRDPTVTRPCQSRDGAGTVNGAGKQLELTTHGNQQRYVVAYQLKPETKQPDILSRVSDEPPEREAPSLVYSGPGITATFMSPCTSPTGSLVSGSNGGLPMRGGAGGLVGNGVGPVVGSVGLTPSDSGGITVSNSNMNLMTTSANGTLRAKEHILTNTIPGPESCV
ncbi:Down syndrome cell adhesion molecule-like protein 1 homolog [Nilaparvata lugens]|uniref:Down syndrome cell adhesion molecule-like protein 1 homolog n=1 Tax=Nilaparvata lugens TaxID=108931 RepID=UPI00193E3D20|nr:Down syndrome cell adhesion molecule-like protein 1 homolog [Nilaparvata lugens]